MGTVTHQIHPDQLNLLAEPRHRASDPDTSRVAAAAVKASNPHRMNVIVELVAAAGTWGRTADEIWKAACDIDDTAQARQQTWRGAISRACESGRIEPRADGARRMSLLNWPQIVYVTPANQRGNHVY